MFKWIFGNGCSSVVERLPTLDNTLGSLSALQEFFFFKAVLGKSPWFGASVSKDQGQGT